MEMKKITHAATAALYLGAWSATASVVTFETFSLPAPGFAIDGSGGFVAEGVTFNNNYDDTTEVWSGFAISNRTDTTNAGPANAFSAITGSGFGGSSNYAIGLYATTPAATTHVIFSSATDLVGLGAYFTNTTWAALDMLNGTSPGSKKFGGPSGNDPDWLKLTIQGFAGASSTGQVEFFLADFTNANNALDYVVENWRFVNFSALGSPDRLEMSLSFSNTGLSGIPSLSYFAMDQFLVVPEPSSVCLGLAGIGLLFRRKR
jgi:hypothetical protein